MLLQKPRSPLETYNDLDGNVVNFFRVLRDRPDELIRKIRLTPWARAEYELSLEPCEDEVERARRFFIGLQMSFNGASDEARGKYWRIRKEGDSPAFELCNLSHLDEISERLRFVQVENRPAVEVIERYDGPDALIYFDPPYVEETRTKNDWYNLDWNGSNLHTQAAALLRQAAGFVIVSGYACPLYTELYEAHGWQRVDKEAQTNSGGKRIESLWLSPRTVKALNNDYSHLPMFSQAA